MKLWWRAWRAMLFEYFPAVMKESVDTFRHCLEHKDWIQKDSNGDTWCKLCHENLTKIKAELPAVCQEYMRKRNESSSSQSQL